MLVGQEIDWWLKTNEKHYANDDILKLFLVYLSFRYVSIITKYQSYCSFLKYISMGICSAVDRKLLATKIPQVLLN